MYANHESKSGGRYEQNFGSVTQENIIRNEIDAIIMEIKMSYKIINKDKPLPDHTKLRYEECYAKRILEYYFSDKYENISIMDKPDLYDTKNDIGIEVTEAIETKRKESLKLWYNLPYKEPTCQLKNKERIRKLGIDYQDGILFGTPVQYSKGAKSKTYDIVYNTIENKLKKLNKEGLYQKARLYNLFIISELMIEQDWYYDFIDKVKNIYLKYKKTFDVIYLLSQNNLAEFDIMKNKCIKEIDIDNDQHSIAITARKMVEDGEIMKN
jgi:hypothetical protein